MRPFSSIWRWFTVVAAMLLATGCTPTTKPKTAINWMNPEKDLAGLFEAVQEGHIFPDSKTFPDCVPLASPEEIMAAYNEEKDQPGFVLAIFVQKYFVLPTSPASGFVADTGLSVEDHILQLWPILTRQPDSGSHGSLIPLPHPYIVPGGRFGEIYYWDSYFTMLGLQVSPGGPVMIRNMIENFAYLIDTVGFIPNGNRTYFLTRSQPPFFACMVELLSEIEGDKVYAEFLPQLEKEYAFWMAGRETLSPAKPETLQVALMPDGKVLNRYWDRSEQPRPESYREDVALAQQSERNPKSLYRDLRSACASGWDFSSRWMSDPLSLASIHTTDILPCDLNALMLNLEQTLAKAYRQAGREGDAKIMDRLVADRTEAIHKYLYNKEAGYFADYDFNAQKFTGVPSAAMMFPLYFEVANREEAASTVKAMQEYLLSPGGILTTPNHIGQQWDAPNGWAPLQWIAVQGLYNYGFEDIGDDLANRWVQLNTKVYKHTGKCVEKYNVEDIGLEAGGGEYPLQDGFGWTNGVLLRLIKNKQSGS